MQNDYFCVDKCLGRLFASYGRVLSRHPVVFLVSSLILSVILGLGMLRLDTEDGIESLYTPKDSQASVDRERVRQNFPVNTGDNFYPYQMPTIGMFGEIIAYDNQKLRTQNFLEYIKHVTNEVWNLTFVYDGQLFNYSDVCAARNGKCVVIGDYVTTKEFRDIYNGGNLQYPVHYDKYGTAHDMRSILGKPRVENGFVVKFEAIKLMFFLKEDNETQKNMASAWELAFLDLMRNIHSLPGQLGFQTSQSLQIEIEGNAGGNVMWVALTFTMMIIYVSLVASGGDCVTSRGHLARAGVFSTGLAIVAAFGLLSACGLKIVNTVGVSPFLALGKGIDDMFILMAGYSLTNPKKSPEERVSQMFRTSAGPITVTTLTDLVAFSISATSSYIGIRNFCLYTGITLLFCYINIVFFFGACVVFHARRVEQMRHQFTCHVVPSRNESPNESKAYKDCCTGQRPENPGDDASPCERAPGIWLPKLILNKHVKPIILLLFGGYLAASIWGAMQLEEGLELKHLVNDESYWRNYSDLNTKYFTARGPVIQLMITGPVNYWDWDVDHKIADVIAQAQSTKYILDDFSISWVDEYRKFLSAIHPNKSAIEKAEYIQRLRKEFLPVAQRFKNDISFSSNDKEISSSRVYVQGDGLVDPRFQGQMMLTIRDVVSKSELPMLAYSAPFIFFEQYVTILSVTLQTCGIAVGAMFVLGMIFIPHPLSVVYITITMVMILVGMFGFMHFWGLTLSSITMITMVLSIGFCIDFSSHVCHAFMNVEYVGKSKDYRAEKAVEKVGVPILNSAVSSLLGILFLIFTKSYAFQSFFKTIFLIIILGMAHALFLLPVLLSYIGPPVKTICDEISYPKEPESINIKPTPQTEAMLPKPSVTRDIVKASHVFIALVFRTQENCATNTKDDEMA